MFKKVINFFVPPTTEDLYQLKKDQISEIINKFDFDYGKTLEFMSDNKCYKISFRFQESIAFELAEKLEDLTANDELCYNYTRVDIMGIIRSLYEDKYTSIIEQDIDNLKKFYVYFVKNEIVLNYFNFTVIDRFKKLNCDEKVEMKNDVINLIARKKKKVDIEKNMTRKYNTEIRLRYLKSVVFIVVK